jgi:hypothetical protein
MSESHPRAGRERLRGDDVREDEQTNDEDSDLTTHGITLRREVTRISRYARPASIGHRT